MLSNKCRLIFRPIFYRLVLLLRNKQEYFYWHQILNTTTLILFQTIFKRLQIIKIITLLRKKMCVKTTTYVSTLKSSHFFIYTCSIKMCAIWKGNFLFWRKKFIKERVMYQSKRNLDANYRSWNFEQFVQIAEDMAFLLQYIRCFLDFEILSLCSSGLWLF